MNKLNNQHMRAVLVVGIVSLAVLAAGLAAAQGPGVGKGKGMGKGMGEGMGMGMGRDQGFGIERMAARLDLTEEQATAIKAIHENSRKDATELRKEVMRLRNELQGEMLKDDPSEKAVLSLNEKLGSLKTKLQANRLKTRLAVRELLTPEQRDQMLMMSEHPGRGEHAGRGERGDRGDKNGPRSGRHHSENGTCPKTTK